MAHYPPDDRYEREPLDPSHDSPYDTPSRHDVYQQSAYPHASPYHDESPSRRRGDSSSFSHHQDVRDGSPPRQDHQAPPPPRHGDYNYYSGNRSSPPLQADTAYHGYSGPSNITPGADNFSDAASGGMSGIAHSVADRNARESGLEAYRSAGQLPPPPSRVQQHPSAHAPRQAYSSRNSGLYAGGYNDHSQETLERGSHSSLNPFGTVASSPMASRSPSRSPHVSIADAYAVEDPYQSYAAPPRRGPTTLGMVDPDEIADDGDDGLGYGRRGKRNSGMSGRNTDKGRRGRPAIGAAAAVGAAASGTAAGALGKDYHGDYKSYDQAGREKSSAWLAKKKTRNKRMKVAIIILVLLIIAGAIVGGVVGSFVNNKKGDDGSKSTSDDEKGDLDKNSDEIKKLLNNPDLHKVFPGMDYTPINSQYPYCIHDPPSQNNVTRDIAVLSQLTNKIRLYGTDCNQTQMVVHAIDRLDLKKDVKVWLGVWQDGNATTNARQLSQMWDILDEYGGDPFEGIIVANEILFREEMTISTLGTLLSEVRTNLTKLNIDLPVATSDLGNDWSQALADESDYVMSNIHPFFSGTPADEAAAWTWNFWEDHNGGFWKSDKSKNIIAEIGWPSAGGKSCPPDSPNCPEPVPASIDGMNQLLEDWVCPAMENGTNYFWFEAFDEPWKVRFNEEGKEWEDKWGLMDVNRKLKKGVKIPDCGGKTV